MMHVWPANTVVSAMQLGEDLYQDVPSEPPEPLLTILHT